MNLIGLQSSGRNGNEGHFWCFIWTFFFFSSFHVLVFLFSFRFMIVSAFFPFSFFSYFPGFDFLFTHFFCLFSAFLKGTTLHES